MLKLIDIRYITSHVEVNYAIVYIKIVVFHIKNLLKIRSTKLHHILKRLNSWSRNKRKNENKRWRHIIILRVQIAIFFFS